MTIRCLGEMIAHIDGLGRAPTSAQIEEIIERFREKERSYYSSQVAADCAAGQITEAEIKSILRTKRFRTAVGRNGWKKEVKRRKDNTRLGKGIVSVTKGAKTIDMGRANMQDYDLFRFASADVYLPENGERKLLLCFFADEAGDYKLSFKWKAPPFFVRCGGTLGRLGVKPGHYKMVLMDAANSEFMIDFEHEARLAA